MILITPLDDLKVVTAPRPAKHDMPPIDVVFRPLTNGRETQDVQDRLAFLAMRRDNGAYFKRNDVASLPQTEVSYQHWLTGDDARAARVVVAVFDVHGACLGFAGADGRDRGISLWYGVAPCAQGRGLAIELAYRSTMDLLRLLPDSRSARLTCRDTNGPSRGVATALGMRHRAGDGYSTRLTHDGAPACFLSFEGSIARFVLAHARRSNNGWCDVSQLSCGECVGPGNREQAAGRDTSSIERHARMTD